MAAIVGEERYVFETDWYDQQAAVVRQYRVTYYPGDQTVEMVRSFYTLSNQIQYDSKNKRIFLKRYPQSGIDMKALYIGAVIVV
jgi:hypothetical protein